MRLSFILLAALMASEAGAIEISSVYREVSYSGGLENPDMMSGFASSSAVGVFSESFSDSLSVPPNELAGADVSQVSSVVIQGGALFVDVTSESGAYATTLAEGLIADAYASSTLAVVFTTSETMRLSVHLAVSSSLGVFYDGPGAGEVASSHIGSLLLCLSGVGCLADIEVQDFTDNGQAVANGIFDSIDIPPGTYQLGLIADSAVISQDEGSSLGGAEFSGYIAVEPLPEPGPGAMWLAGIAFLATRQRSRARGR